MRARRLRGRRDGVTSYWNRFNVTLHEPFSTREQSLERLRWRNGHYLFYEDFLPLETTEGLTVLDYGCGPGEDLVAFAEWGAQGRLIGADISARSLAEARARLALHGPREVEFIETTEDGARLDELEGEVDLIWTSGVLHHIPELSPVMARLRSLLTPGGRMIVMVYNRDSVWFHLHVAYQRRILQGLDREVSIEDAFRRTTDGDDCPYSVCWTPGDFIALAGAEGFDARFLGAAISIRELEWLQADRLGALGDRRLPAEHRNFLARLTFDSHGRPLHDGAVAGIDALYELTPA